MMSLQTLLETRTHRELELLARAHKLPFTRRIPKAQGLAQLSQALHAGAYSQAITRLAPPQVTALQAIVAAGDWLPLPLFTAHFGEIRPYRPWRQDFAPRHPWRYPASSAERLVHLGIVVVVDDDMVTLTAEAKALLPPLPQATPLDMPIEMKTASVASRGALTRAALLRDVAVLLGVLMGTQARPVHGRWLSLRVLQRVNTHLSTPEDLSGVRSELQSGRLRWLHYLAQVAGLLAVQGGIFQPTQAAWTWLTAPPDAQWSALMQAIEHDLETRERLWDQYRFPAITTQTWRTLRHTLAALSADAVYRVRDLFESLLPYLLPDSRYAIACTLRDCFVWSGILVRRRGHFGVYSQTFAEAFSAHISLYADDDTLALSVSDLAPSAALMRLHAVAHVENGIANLNAAALQRAVQQGMDAASLVEMLATLMGEGLSTDIQHQLVRWEAQARQLTLQPMTVLHAPDAATIQRIRDDWRLAGHLTQRLSPHHLAVVSEDADRLRQRLERRDYTVTSLLRPVRDRRITAELNPHMAEYLLLAVRTYQQLHNRLAAPIYIPQALTHWLSAQVTDDTSVAAIEASAATLVAAVEQKIPASYPAIDSGRQDTASIRRQLVHAHQHGLCLTIDYYSPYHDSASTRTIRIRSLDDDNDQTYITAYCQLADDERTFRLDRIQRIHDDVSLHDMAM